MGDSYKRLLIFQIVLFCLLIIGPWFGLMFGWVHIPTGLEGQWFDKFWDILLAVSSFTTLSTVIKVVDDHYSSNKGGNTDEKTIVNPFDTTNN